MVQSNFENMNSSQWLNVLNKAVVEGRVESYPGIHEKTTVLSLKQIEKISKNFTTESSHQTKLIAKLIVGIAQNSSKSTSKIAKFTQAVFNAFRGKGFKTQESRLLDLAYTMDPEQKPSKKENSISGKPRPPHNSQGKPVLERAKFDPDTITTYIKGEQRTADLIPTQKEVLGKGVFGTVHVNRSNATQVIKKVRQNITDEYKLGNKLNHPCIVKSRQLFIKHYPGINQTPVYKVVMDKIEGENILACDRKTPTEIRSLLNDVKSTAKYLFDQRVFWGDVNAYNTYITPDGHLKLCDLGFWGEEEKTEQLTKRLLLGTMEVCKNILRASSVDSKDVSKIFKPPQFFKKIPSHSQIFSQFGNDYDKEPWMKEVIKDIKKLKPEERVQYLEKYIDAVIENFTLEAGQ